MSLRYGRLIRLGKLTFRPVHRNEAFIGYAVCDRRRWLAALPEPAGIFPFVTDADGRVVRWRRREDAVLALAVNAEGFLGKFGLRATAPEREG